MTPRQASSQPRRLDLEAGASKGPSSGRGCPAVVGRPVTITTMPETVRLTQDVATPPDLPQGRARGERPGLRSPGVDGAGARTAGIQLLPGRPTRQPAVLGA